MFLRDFPVLRAGERKTGHEDGIDAVVPPTPGDIPDLEFYRFRRSTAKRLFATVVVRTVAVKRPVCEIGADGFELADGTGFSRHPPVESLFIDDEAVKTRVLLLAGDDEFHEVLGLLRRAEDPEFPHERGVRAVGALVPGTGHRFQFEKTH